MHRQPVIHVCEALGGGILRVVGPLANATAGRDLPTTVVYGRRPETPGDLSAHFDAAVRLVPVPGWGDRSPWASLRSMAKAARILRREISGHPVPGVLHVHSTYAGLVGRLVGAPRWRRFYTPHGYVFLNPSKPRSIRNLARCCEFVLGRRGHTLACSQTEGAVAARLVGRGRVTVVLNGIDPVPATGPSRRSDDGFRVVSVGRAAFQRRPDLVAEVALLLAGEPDIEVRWIGDGPERAVLSRAGVSLTGWLDQEAAYEELGAADAVLHLSAFEGLPFALLEAMARRLPVIASDLPVIREVLGDTGVLVAGAYEAAAAALRLKADSAAGDDLAERAADRVRRHFTRSGMVDGALAAYGVVRSQGPKNDV
jgi:glycosyltransferase involved in cell wall biosynthesis